MIKKAHTAHIATLLPHNRERSGRVSTFGEILP
jgi:hypothetical protein